MVRERLIRAGEIGMLVSLGATLVDHTIAAGLFAVSNAVVLFEAGKRGADQVPPRPTPPAVRFFNRVLHRD